MLIEDFMPLLDRFKGCTFASLDAETKIGGVRKITTNERVILFSNSRSSGYENMVRRRLEQIGREPQSFVVGDLPWGERIPDTPLIRHRGFYYLQAVQIEPGIEQYFLGSKLIAQDMLGAFGINPRGNNQGLPHDKAVKVHCYALEHITGIRLLGESLEDKQAPRPRRRKLGLFTG